MQQRTLLARQPVDAGSEDALHGVRDLHVLDALCQPEAGGLAHQNAGLHQRSRHLLEEQRRAVGLFDHPAAQRVEIGRIAQQALQQRIRRGVLQRPELHERVVAVAGPAVLVLGPVGDDDQQVRGPQAVHDGIEQRLALEIGPVHVLDD